MPTATSSHATVRDANPTNMRLRRGDSDAFDDVHGAFNTRLFTFLVRLSRRRDVAEDLLEETWLG
jgi:DNA-directed RNA polymerase specialized sigma24 family protein